MCNKRLEKITIIFIYVMKSVSPMEWLLIDILSAASKRKPTKISGYFSLPKSKP